MKLMTAPGDEQVVKVEKVADVSRRRFFQLAGGITGAGLLLAACRKSPPNTKYLGSGDIALLNFLYILNQLEAQFYTQASTPGSQYYGMTHLELLCITDLRDQEIAHSEFLKSILGANAVPIIKVNFSAVTFADRTSVLTNAATIEDLVVSGLNSAANLFVNQTYALAFTKMVSVEARHSAYVRDSLTPNSFGANVINSNGLDQVSTPAAVLAAAEAYIETTFDSSKLPN